MKILPATLQRVPRGDWGFKVSLMPATMFSGITGYGQIKHRGKVVGEFEQSREGGSFKFAVDTVAAERSLEDFAREMVHLNGSETADGYVVEQVLYWFTMEEVLVQELRGCLKAGRVPYLSYEDLNYFRENPFSYGAIYAGRGGGGKGLKSPEGVAAFIRSLGMGDGWRSGDDQMVCRDVWDGKQWVSVRSIFQQ